MTYDEKTTALSMIEDLRLAIAEYMRKFEDEELDVTTDDYLTFLDEVAAKYQHTEAEMWAYEFVLKGMKTWPNSFKTGKKWTEMLGLDESQSRKVGMALTRLHKEGRIAKQKGEGKGAVMEYAYQVGC